MTARPNPTFKIWMELMGAPMPYGAPVYYAGPTAVIFCGVDVAQVGIRMPEALRESTPSMDPEQRPDLVLVALYDDAFEYVDGKVVLRRPGPPLADVDEAARLDRLQARAYERERPDLLAMLSSLRVDLATATAQRDLVTGFLLNVAKYFARMAIIDHEVRDLFRLSMEDFIARLPREISAAEFPDSARLQENLIELIERFR